jgi:hypothetical protein
MDEEKDKEIEYAEMLDLYLDGKLFWCHQNTYCITKTDKNSIKQMLALVNRKDPEYLHYKSKIKNWRIMLNLRLDEIIEQEQQKTENHDNR